MISEENNQRAARALRDAEASALTKVLTKMKAGALREAASEILEAIRRDELAMNAVGYYDLLPTNSKNMLNGAARFAERLNARAADLDKEAGA